PGGPDRPRREAGGRLRPQGVDAPGRRGASSDRDRLFERRHSSFRQRAGRRHAVQPCDLVAHERVGAVMVSREEIDRRYGLVRAFEAAHLRVEFVPFDVEFDLARAVKSAAEIESVRDSVRINTEGFWAFLEEYRPGRSAAAVLAPAERLFVEEGCGRLTMNMVLVGAEFALARDDTLLGDFCVPSLEIAGPGGHWVEVSRALGEWNG